MKPYISSIEELEKIYSTDIKTGLKSNNIDKLKNKYGINSLSSQKKIKLYKKIYHTLNEPMNFILLVAFGITFCINIMNLWKGKEADWFESLGILFAIFLSTFITLIMEGRSNKAYDKIKKISSNNTALVLRDGLFTEILFEDICPGDIVKVQSGDKIPADGRIISCDKLSTDESSLTGESKYVNKKNDVKLNENTPLAERKNMLYSGTFVVSGEGLMLVTSIGENTEFGIIAKVLSKEKTQLTPLQIKLSKLGKIIAIIGLSSALCIFLIQLTIFKINNELSTENAINAFVTSIVLIVASVPEGLPTIVAASLAINILRLSKKNALVKKMIASETIGSVNIICTDKTGTLTKNMMTLENDINNNLIIENIAFNSTAVLSKNDKFTGNPTECALLEGIREKVNISEMKSKIQVIEREPFSSDKKMMMTCVKYNSKVISYVKGSKEKIFSLCKNNNDIQNDNFEIIKEEQKGKRIITFAHKYANEFAYTYDGYAVISDPLRDDVYDAILKARNSGIEVMILTGDNINTATSIAKSLNLINDDSLILEGKNIEAMSNDDLRNIVGKIRVIARSTPETKMRVVKSLRRNGYVVAVTGDGINDAPALKNADVGISMGISGTDVSKEVSDVILLDDSFKTIIMAIEWGRGIYENFKRFILFQLTVNISSILVILFSIIMGLDSPFTAIELLWINIIMDGPPALALGLGNMDHDLMNKEPTKKNESIVTKNMFIRIITNGLFISFLVLAESLTGFLGGTENQKCTIVFTLFVILQLFNAFTCKNECRSNPFLNIWNNKILFFTIILTFILQFCITQYGSEIFNTVPLDSYIWLKMFGLGVLLIILSELAKPNKLKYCSLL